MNLEVNLTCRGFKNLVLMKFLAFSRTGTRTFMVFARSLPLCAKRDVAAVTTESSIRPFSHFGNLFRLPAAQFKSRIARASDARYCELPIALFFAAITLAIISGCGGSSGSSQAPAAIVPATPSISPGTGTYTGTQQVTISDTTQGAILYYTIDGTVPNASSTAYASAISITASSTVQAIAILGGASSTVASSALTITPAHPPAKLAFVQQPSNTLTGVAISPAVQVMVQDANGNAVTNATNPVTLALTSGTGLAGTLTVTPQNGIAAFSNLTLSTVGSYTLAATSSGLTSATSSSFTVDMPAQLAFIAQPSNVVTGAVISPAIQVAVQDSAGNTLTAATNPVTLALTAGTGLGGTLTATPQNGVATFSSLTVGAAGSYTLVASSSGLTSSTSASFTVTTPVKLAFIVQPSNVFTGTAVSPAVQVAIQDANGKTVTADSSPVTLALAGSTALGGTLTTPAQSGVATFNNLMVSAAGSYMLTATSPNLPSATSANFTVTVAPVTYYLSPTGSDSNTGLSTSEAWLSPDHPVNCGDTIIAASSTAYDQRSFAFGKWGPVTCSPGATANVVWLKCAAFDTCKMTATNQDAMWVTSSYWGVQGWEVTATGGQAICFASFPPTPTANLHHIIFANDIANGCYGAGFEPIPNGSAGTDYFVLVGNIAYNAAQQSNQCGSAITIFEPAESDQLPGTHIYVAGNYTWDNVDAHPCAGGTPTDGEGIIFDTFDANNYTQQAVMDNNVAFLNGASGFRVDKTSKAPVYVVNNTAFGNNTDSNLNTIWCGEITLQESKGINVTNNIARATSATGCGANPSYALFVADGDATDVVATNFAYGIAGQNAGQSTSPGFSYATSNILGIDPLFVNPPTTDPGPPNCAGSASVAQCMASTFAGLLPKTPSAVGLGIQPLGGTATADPLFPGWLCNVGLPAGLIPNHCP
jgi:Chitobiase/beta-hexosaminidase C-terminal domain